MDVTCALLLCLLPQGSAVSKRGNVGASLIQVKWTAQGEDLDITFRYSYPVTELQKNQTEMCYFYLIVICKELTLASRDVMIHST